MNNPTFFFEDKLWRRRFKLVAGADEVGRGAFAGPVVAAAVVLPQFSNFQFPIFNDTGKEILIRDSKKLTDKQRRVAAEWITSSALTWGIGKASVTEINKLGLSRATYSAFRRSVANANIRARMRVEYLLIDAYYIPYVRGLPVGDSKNNKKSIKRIIKEITVNKRGRQLAIIKGDNKCFSIAAASILAKVHRDDLMIKLGKSHKHYMWDKNKGYGTREHCKAIKRCGTTKWHREKFVERLAN